ncbi:MAG: hypothetical protein IIC88_06395 [Chloroflexi bacterium]|nr:hypothetical protein [Chloroflexota bacterium]
MNRWLDRPGYVAAIAFLGGIAVAVLVVLIIILARGDDGDEPGAATATPDSTPTATPTDSTPAPPSGTPATPLPTGLTDPDEALEAFINEVLEADYIGSCALAIPGGPQGFCSDELYRVQELVTFLLGDRRGEFSKLEGEAIVTRGTEGTWSVTFIQPEGETGVSVGSEGMVYGVGNCLNFRVEPSLSSEVRSCQFDGARAQVVEGPVTADGHTWWRLAGLGWASDLYLRPPR